MCLVPMFLWNVDNDHQESPFRISPLKMQQTSFLLVETSWRPRIPEIVLMTILFPSLTLKLMMLWYSANFQQSATWCMPKSVVASEKYKSWVTHCFSWARSDWRDCWLWLSIIFKLWLHLQLLHLLSTKVAIVIIHVFYDVQVICSVMLPAFSLVMKKRVVLSAVSTTDHHQWNLIASSNFQHNVMSYHQMCPPKYLQWISWGTSCFFCYA